MLPTQLDLFARRTAALDVDETFRSRERLSLNHGAWIDLVPAWLGGSERLFEHLQGAVTWRTDERLMYAKTVAVPRMTAVLPALDRLHPIVDDMRHTLDQRYATRFEKVSAALYRDGRDSVAWHGDYKARERLGDAVVATLSLGGERRFLLRPSGGGRSISFTLRSGDLVVMGGTCQRTYQHCVPKVRLAAPRIALMFRPTWEK